MERQESEVRGELAALSGIKATSNRVRELAQREEALNRELFAKGFISEMRVAQLERDHLQSKLQQTGYDAEWRRARQRLEDLLLRKATMKTDYTRQANDELRETNAQLLRLNENRRPLVEANARQILRAPVAGTIVNFKVRAAGAVVTPGTSLLEVVPSNQPLIVEVHVKPEDIAQLRQRQHAELQLLAYPGREVPMLGGSVSFIGADRLEDPMSREAYYTVRLDIDSSSIAEARRVSRQPLMLMPGMSAQVFITTKSRSPLDYLLSPIVTVIARSMRER